MFKRILTPLDGSTLSEGILPYVRALAPAFGARVDLLRTYQNLAYELTPEDDVDSVSIMAALEPLATRLHNQAQSYLEHVAHGLRGLGVHTIVDVRSGPAAIHIVNEADAVEDTVVAMSTHGRTGLGRWIMGSVTDRVLHTTMAPLLVVHPERGAPSVDSTAEIGTLIVPLDGSDLAEMVLPIATKEVAKALGSQVILAETVGVRGHVRTTVTRGSPAAEIEDPATTRRTMAPPLPASASWARWRTRRRSISASAAAEMRREGVAEVRTTVTRGSPAAEIEELARATPDSMIIACTHGRSGVGRTVLGSVTDRLARHSGHPSLIVRAPH